MYIHTCIQRYTNIFQGVMTLTHILQGTWIFQKGDFRKSVGQCKAKH